MCCFIKSIPIETIYATKKDVKEAIEKLFEVEVTNVNILTVTGKTKVFGRTKGKRKNYNFRTSGAFRLDETHIEYVTDAYYAPLSRIRCASRRSEMDAKTLILDRGLSNRSPRTRRDFDLRYPSRGLATTANHAYHSLALDPTASTVALIRSTMSYIHAGHF